MRERIAPLLYISNFYKTLTESNTHLTKRQLKEVIKTHVKYAKEAEFITFSNCGLDREDKWCITSQCKYWESVDKSIPEFFNSLKKTYGNKSSIKS